MRLQRALAQAGVASRRRAEALIRAGRVQVNGQVVMKLGTKVDPERDQLVVDGCPVSGPQPHVYLLLHKPPGYVTTRRDPQGRPTVMDLIPPELREWVYPVGRLDYQTSGLLLLTNDGDLSFALTHPRHQVDKTYLAEVKGVPAPEALARLRRGILLEDGLTAPAQVTLQTGPERDRSFLILTIHEGRKRQVRRMCAAVGHPVLSLKRLRLGPLTLDALAEGQYRFLTPAEVEALRAAAGN